MKLKITALTVLLFFCHVILAQEKATISGYVKDKNNGESLIGATVVKQGTNIGASANEYGFYSLSLPKGEHVLEVALIGFQTFTIAVNLDKSISQNFELGEASKELDEVTVTSEAADKNITS